MPNLHDFSSVSAKMPRRSMFSLPHRHVFTLSEGSLYPFYCNECLPADTWKIIRGFSARNLQTQVHPVEDDAFIDWYWFFVPKRMLWEKWSQMYGDGVPDDWTNPTNLVEPGIAATAGTSTTVGAGSVLNGLGLPVGLDLNSGIYINGAPLAAYARIWNDWFRDENVVNKSDIPDLYYQSASGSVLDLVSGNVSNAYWIDNCNNNNCRVSKYHDLFTSALPSPQKGDAVSMPLGSAAPVFVGGGTNTTAPIFLMRTNTGTGTLAQETDLTLYNADAIPAGDGSTGRARAYDPNDASHPFSLIVGAANAYADLSNATAATVDDLIKSIAIQNFLRGLARGGSRYKEVLLYNFGTAPLDETLQRPALIGYQHTRLNQQQVASTAGSGTVGTASKTDTGTLGGYSVTSDSKRDVTMSFKEYGYLLGLCAVRVKHTYSQGIPRMFRKKSKWDYFMPAFDRLGEVAIDASEIYATAGGTFGFQEAWYEHRHTPDRVSGLIAPNYNGVGGNVDLRAWTYADNLNVVPTLSQSFLTEGRGNVDQTLAGSNVSPQYIISVDLRCTVTRPMRLNSVPSTLGV